MQVFFIFSDKLCLYKFMNKIIIANWKENPESLEEGMKLIDISEKFEKQISDVFWFKYENNTGGAWDQDIKIAHAVPAIFAEKLYIHAKRTKVILQNISEFEGGSHTGEVSVKQMLNCGIQASIVGHSETRLSPNNTKGDEDKEVNLKIKNLLANNCSTLLCVGEYERIGDYLDFVKLQLDNCLKDVESEDFENIMVAYEPVWAIGKNAKRVATNEEIVEMIKFIKDFIKEKFGVATHVLYGGSVDENNAKEILNLEGVDGLLVGRASSDPEKWGKLLENISRGNELVAPPLPKGGLGGFLQIKDLNIKKEEVVLLRLDLNVPIEEVGGEEKIINDFRIQESLPTIKMLQSVGAKIIILAHREKGGLQVVAEYLKNKVSNFKFINKVVGTEVEKEVANLQAGEVLLLENLRTEEGEKKNDLNFAKTLASYGEYYIDEAFSAGHRKHASIVGVPEIIGKENCALGPKFVEEITKLQLALEPKRPMLLIVGGAKFDTKLAMLEKFLTVADNIFVGGALAHNFWKQKFTYNLGKSLLDEDVKLTEQVLNLVTTGKILLPIDVMIESREIKKPNEIATEERITDFGENSLKLILDLAGKAETIVWNGPLGYYEGGYDWGTKQLLLGLNDLQKKYPGKVIILGGGDTVTEIDKLNEELVNSGKDKLHFTHVSTGGGAMIDFLSNGTLPGIQAVTNS